MTRVRLGLRVLGAASLALFALAAYTPLPNRIYAVVTPTAPLGHADAIVVLGAGIGADGVLGDHSLRRALHGILLHRRGLAPLVIFLGPAHREGPVEAEVRAQLARELGVPADAILALPPGRTTRDEARVVRDVLVPRGLRTVLLVTGGPHMPRARALFERSGLTVVAAPDDEVTGAAERPEDRIALARYLLQEAVARLYHRVAGYL
jgi:uncharacterized SAM-binding protein YcdF (DUF218 family)